ncbi:IclR family transcriptional regulator [Algisphaera agarilytica]|uniref:DNA-binding IclR family transcriptional regulator n=1 Tax=Algisphaera agarilytica TaxID=1385975 RepID=A0A7X0LK69_9BACT|nr:IclR family transcriptional regulator [Algisphaera agarilytica]MBB6429524.1 DNA-binding IclR family transcriptional regulator [Algisphaera agarilytica]
MSANSNDKPAYSVPALEHGLDVLELLIASGEDLTQKQVAAATGKPVSTVFRMLNCLEERGYVQRDAELSTYRPTLRLYGLAQPHPAYRRFHDIAQAPMRALSETIGESCHLSVLDDGQVRVMSHQPSPHAHSLAVAPGSVYPLHRTSAGRLMLADMPRQRAEAILDSRVLAKDFSKKQRSEFLADVQRLGKKRYSIAPSPITPGVLDVGVLLACDLLGGRVALMVPCLQKWSKREQQDVLLPAVQDAAERIAAVFNQSKGI